MGEGDARRMKAIPLPKSCEVLDGCSCFQRGERTPESHEVKNPNSPRPKMVAYCHVSHSHRRTRVEDASGLGGTQRPWCRRAVQCSTSAPSVDLGLHGFTMSAGIGANPSRADKGDQKGGEGGCEEQQKESIGSRYWWLESRREASTRACEHRISSTG